MAEQEIIWCLDLDGIALTFFALGINTEIFSRLLIAFEFDGIAYYRVGTAGLSVGHAIDIEKVKTSVRGKLESRRHVMNSDKPVGSFQGLCLHSMIR